MRPTLDSQAFYERCVRILSEVDDAESSFSHQTSNPRGVLRLDLHGTHATRIVLPRIDEFRARYPGIELVVSSGDRLVDLVREGVDCVVLGERPRDSSRGKSGGNFTNPEHSTCSQDIPALRR